MPLPRLLSAEIYPVSPEAPALFSTRNYVTAKNVMRILRAHKAQRINLKIDRCGRLIISSEYGGNARQSQLGGWNSDEQPGWGGTDDDEPRTYLSGLLIALLKIFSHVDATRFRFDREFDADDNRTPLQILATLGHISYIRFFICDASFHFDTSDHS
tara:strand:+ start:128 stop:598 length:471 start_codon:yes stop_codon:yes gene_type:complete